VRAISVDLHAQVDVVVDEERASVLAAQSEQDMCLLLRSDSNAFL
jgi:hypothetical protein